MATSKLLDLYQRDPQGRRAVVVQNLQDGVREDNLQNYLEVICREEITDILFPLKNCNVVVAVFENDVDDLDVWQDRSANRPFEGAILDIQILGRPKGIFVVEVPQRVSEEYLSLYFESKRSGGEEEAVERVNIHDVDGSKTAVVEITSDTAIRSILSKQTHRLRDDVVLLEPYYPSVHKKRIQKPMPKSRGACVTQIKEKRSEEDMITQQRQHQVETRSGDIHISAEWEQPPLFKHDQSLAREAINIQSSALETKGLGSEARQSKMKQRPGNTADQSVEYKKAFGTASRLKIISDDLCDEFVRKSHDSTSHKDMAQIVYQRSDPVKSRNVAAVKPTVRSLQRQVSSDDEQSQSRKRRPKQKERKDSDSEKQALECVEEISLKSVQIIMLVIFRFQMKTQNERLRVIVNKKDGIVIIKGSTETDVRGCKLKLFECLDKVVSTTEKLTPMRSKFLEREPCKICIRTRCIKEKVRATIEINSSDSTIRAYAFSLEDAEKGLKLVQEEITVMKVRLRTGQDQLLHDADWKEIVCSLDNGLAAIYVDGASREIVIESFLEPKAKEACNKIIQFLKTHVPKKSAEVILESAKARCFKACLESKMKRDIEQRHGRIVVEEVCKAPFKIKINVEGEESLTFALTKTVGQIWHEYIDFKKISNRDEDKWLILKGLDCSAGTRFFRTFETGHNCFIEVSRDGEFTPTKPRVKVEDVAPITEDDTVHTGTEFEFSKPEADFRLFDEDFRHYKQTQKQTKVLYQAGLDDDEALSRAMVVSAEEQEPEMNTYGEYIAADAVANDGLDEDDVFPMTRRQRYQDRRPVPRPRRDHVHRSASSPTLRTLHADKPRSETVQIQQTTVTLTQGEIVRQRADALVNIVSKSHNMMEGVVSKAFVKRAGSQIVEMYDNARGNGAIGIVVETASCGRLKCSSVLHIVLVKGEAHCQQMIKSVMKQVFQICQNQGYSSVAFPPLGVGRMYEYPAETVAETMLSETSNLLQSAHYRLNEITFVVFDDATYTVFENEFKTFDPSAMKRNRPGLAPRPFYTEDPFQQRNTLQQQRLHQLQQLSQFKQVLMSPSQSSLKPTPVRTSVASRLQRGHPSSRLSPKETIKPTRVRSQHRVSPGTVDIYDPDTRRSDYRAQQGVSKNEQPRIKNKRHRSRFPDKKAASNIRVLVVAESQETCVRARNELGKRIKEDYLHEEKLDKLQKISDVTKRKIVDIIVANDIESIKGKDKYTLRGCKDKVTKARTDILELLLKEKDSKEVRRSGKGNVQRETMEFAKYMAEEEPGVPSYWNTYKQDVTLKTLLISLKHVFTGQNFTKARLDTVDPIFQAIKKMMTATFDPSKIGHGQDAKGLENLNYSLHVVEIYRIENLDLYEKYTSVRQKMFRKLLMSRDVRFPKIENLPKCSGPIRSDKYVKPSLDKDLHPEINEVLLFHGTKEENIGTICSSGLDPRLASGKAMLGSGVYGAESSTKADQYSDDKTKRTAGSGQRKKMCLIRMLLGNPFLCTDTNPYKYRRPPCTSCFQDDCRQTGHEGNKFGHMFDSVVGDNGKLFREFVVYEGSMCYPEYLITYERI